MDRNHLVIGLFIVLLAAATGTYAMWGGQRDRLAYDLPGMTGSSTPTEATSTPAAPDATPTPSSSDHGYGTATLKLNEVASFPDGLSIRPTAVLEDSRCPTDVVCIQAGTVRVSLRVRSASGASANEFKIGSTLTTETQSITFVDATPVKRSSSAIAPTDYRFTFKVEKRTDIAPVPGPCYVGGCSAQLCTDDPQAISTCEYQAQYSCYRTATCERQPTGQCGWTPTPELQSCLLNPPRENATTTH